ncbi:MAG: exodeoxyribonuclease VII large subunit [Chitinophagales bacterium]
MIDRGNGPRILSIGQLTAYLCSILENDLLMQNAWIRGEVADFKYHQKSGHMYFTLKDDTASISCVMFRSKARAIGFVPENGMKVIARGYVSVFERYGRYQFYAEDMEPDGLGRLYMMLNQLKERLEKEGLFDSRRKRPLPHFVNCLGVVTSADGAALRDIVRVVRQRHPGCEIVLRAANVQGKEAAGEIIRAIKELNEWGKPEVIIVGRGGGSLEDLWAFNIEEVVRAVSASRIPIISAVGHEVDISLCDLAADARAATPTQAAQMAVPDMAKVSQELMELGRVFKRGAERRLNLKWAELDYLRERKVWKNPKILLERRQRDLDYMMRDIQNCMKVGLGTREQMLNTAAAGLEALSPLKVLKRGYSITTSETGEVVKNAADIKEGEILGVILQDGKLKVKVMEKGEAEWKI